jgi:hypothetical protein
MKTGGRAAREPFGLGPRESGLGFGQDFACRQIDLQLIGVASRADPRIGLERAGGAGNF